MKFNTEKLEEIGRGKEKRVFLHPNEKKVIATVYRGSPERLKGKYYLTKILHLLYPKNIPDIHLVITGDTPTIVSELKSLDSYHRSMQAYVVGMPGKYLKEAVPNKSSRNIVKDPACTELLVKLESLGVGYDKVSLNFGYDEEGNIVYADNSFNPWSVYMPKTGKPKRIEWGFDKEKLVAAINALPEAEKERATAFLSRIEKLAEEDWEKAKNMKPTKSQLEWYNAVRRPEDSDY